MKKSFFWRYNIDCQPQIPAEETTEDRNVRPGLCPKIFMHETMLYIFYSFCIHTYFFIKLHTVWPTV